jgi:hypothetical protein
MQAGFATMPALNFSIASECLPAELNATPSLNVVDSLLAAADGAAPSSRLTVAGAALRTAALAGSDASLSFSAMSTYGPTVKPIWMNSPRLFVLLWYLRPVASPVIVTVAPSTG